MKKEKAKKLDTSSHKPRGCGDFVELIQKQLVELYAVFMATEVQMKKDYIHDSLAKLNKDLAIVEFFIEEGHYHDR